MKNIFAFCNQKGGVGKTTSVINLSAVLVDTGYRILIVDMDAQANATSGLGLGKPTLEESAYQLIAEESPPESLVTSTSISSLNIIRSNADLAGAEIALINKIGREFSLRDRLEGIKRNYDFVFIDCPPSLGLVTINALTACNYMIIPLQCEYYALEGLGQLLHTVERVKRNLNRQLEIGGVLLTMADFRTNLTQQVIEEVKNYFKERVFESIIPRSVRLSEAPSFGKPAVIYSPSSRGAQAYREAAAEFEKKFGSEKNAGTERMEEPTGTSGVKKESAATKKEREIQTTAEANESEMIKAETAEEAKP